MFRCKEIIVSSFLLILCVNNCVKSDNFKDKTHWKKIENNAWIDFVKKFQLKFDNDHEMNLRRRIFLSNLRRVVRHNLDFKENRETYEMRIYEYAQFRFKELEETDSDEVELDHENLQDEEYYDKWNNQFGFSIKNDSDVIEAKDGFIYIPKIKEYQTPLSFDWRDRGIITSIKDQGGCGSCYAVTSIDVLESRLLMKTRRHTELSIQEIVDCSKNYDNDGCDGGNPQSVYQYIKDKGKQSHLIKVQ
jgi:C1A family cysteine protease